MPLGPFNLITLSSGGETEMRKPETIDEWNAFGSDCFPGLVGLKILHITPTQVKGEFTVSKSLKAPNGFLHAGSVVTLADTCCGYGTVRSLPDDALGFTTINLSSSFLGTARDGQVICNADAIHQGRTTQVWDAQVISTDSGKIIAYFRCTQMILWPAK